MSDSSAEQPNTQRLLSIVIPAYNEEATLEEIVRTVIAAPASGLNKELIIVNDCSTDQTHALAERLATEHDNVRVFHHPDNRGKGAALHTGFAQCRGDYVVIQDADLEYDPNEYDKLLAPLLADKADVVFGSRFVGGESHRVLYFWHSVGNHILTLLSNMMTDINLTDMETCYKMFRREIIQSLTLREPRFGFEPEVTAKTARLGCRIYEVGISYYGRTYAEGKKINWRDGFRAIYCIIKYRFMD